MKSAVLAAVLLSSTAVVMGQTTTNLSFTVNQNIPQGDRSVPNFSSIVSLTVPLDISGGLNGVITGI